MCYKWYKENNIAHATIKWSLVIFSKQRTHLLLTAQQLSGVIILTYPLSPSDCEQVKKAHTFALDTNKVKGQFFPTDVQ